MVSVVCPQCVQLLLRYGCDPEMTDNDGLTAAELADLTGHGRCADVIRRADATGKLHGNSVSWSQIRPGPDLTRFCRIWDRNGSGPGLSVVTNIVSVSNTSSIPIIMIVIRKFSIKMLSVLRKLGPGVMYVTIVRLSR